jgi:hypothetical protein
LKSIVGLSALALAVSASEVGPAFAQAPVAPTIVAESPDNQSKDDPKAAEEQPKPDKPKAEKPKGETPAVDASAQPPVDAAKPKPEKPKVTDPKATSDKPKSEKPKLAEPKPKPEEPKATAKEPKPEQPKPAEPTPKPEKPKATAKGPKPEQPKPSEPKPKPDKPKLIADDPGPPRHVHDGSSSAQDLAPGPVTQDAPRQTASPAGPAAYSVVASRAGHVSVTPARQGQPTTALTDRDGAAGAAPLDPAPLRAGGHPVDAMSATGQQADRATTHAARLARDDAAAAAAPGERQQTRTLPLAAGPPGYNLMLLLAVVLTVGIAFLIGHHTRRHPRLGTRR